MAGISALLFRDIVENCADGIVVITAEGRIAYLNQAAEQMFGWPLRRALGRPIEIFMPEQFRSAHPGHIEAFHRAGEPARRMGDRLLRTYGLKADGTEFPTDISIMESDSETGTVFVALVRDITEQVEMETRLEDLANTDPLTGVSNRRAFLTRAAQEVAEARRYDVPLSAAMIDIDRFKALNDRFGHAIGDRVLLVVATQLSGALRKPDIFARWGGEEFICLLPHTDADLAKTAAERLRCCIDETSVAATDVELARVTVSIGVASLAETDRSIDMLIDRADRGLYIAKQTGRNKVVLQHPDDADTAQSAA